MLPIPKQRTNVNIVQFVCISCLVLALGMTPLQSAADGYNPHGMPLSPADARLMDQFQPYVVRDSRIEDMVDGDIRAGNMPQAIKDGLKRMQVDRHSLQELSDNGHALKKMVRMQLFFACDELGQLYEYERDYVHALMFYCARWFYGKTGELPSDFYVDSAQTLRLINRKPPFSPGRYESVVSGTHIPIVSTAAAICYYRLGNYGMACLAAVNLSPDSEKIAVYQKLNASHVWNLPAKRAKLVSDADRYYAIALSSCGFDVIGSHLTVRRLNAALKIEPRNPEVWNMLGTVYGRGFLFNEATVRDLLSAITYYRQAARFDPNNAKYWDEIGGPYEAIDQILQVEPNSTSLTFLTMIQYARNAIAAYKVSLGIKVNYDTPHTIAYLESQIKSWQQTVNLLQHEKLEDDLVKQEQSAKHK